MRSSTMAALRVPHSLTDTSGEAGDRNRQYTQGQIPNHKSYSESLNLSDPSCPGPRQQ
jgi:hypothetical protein